MLKIAVISDVKELLDLTKSILTKRGYEVSLYSLSHENLAESIVNDRTDFVIIDFFSDPDASLVITKEISQNKIYTLAVLDESVGTAIDFRSGVDDFIFKESYEREIELRLMLFKWKYQKIDSKEKIIVSEFVVDNANYEVTFKGNKIDLTYKEFELLKFLITNTGRVFSRDALLNQVWGYNYYGGTRTVDVHIRRLRAKIGAGIDNYLKTIRNVGYKFDKQQI